MPGVYMLDRWQSYVVDPHLPPDSGDELHEALCHRDEVAARVMGDPFDWIVIPLPLVMLAGVTIIARTDRIVPGAGSLVVAALLGLVAVIVGFVAAVGSVTDRRAQRRLDKYRDKWVDTREFDESARAIWRKVELAVSEAERAAAASDVRGETEARGLLGDQGWGIAQELAAQSRLRRDGAMEDARASRDLATAVASSSRRASAVAAYARQLTALAAAASAPRREAEAARLRDRARDLVAATA